MNKREEGSLIYWGKCGEKCWSNKVEGLGMLKV